jgi:hypothetical protein
MAQVGEGWRRGEQVDAVCWVLLNLVVEVVAVMKVKVFIQRDVVVAY